jgi:hypothetical protein
MQTLIIKSLFQEEVLFFPNPADQESHVKAFTYKCLTERDP